MLIAAIGLFMRRLLSDRPGIDAPVNEIRDVNHRDHQGYFMYLMSAERNDNKEYNRAVFAN